MESEHTTHTILGRLPPGWRVERLKDLCRYLQRGRAPTYVDESDVRALNQKAIRWGRIEDENLKYHDPNVPIAAQHFVRAGDLVINSTGDITIGRAYLFRETPSAMFADSHVTIVRTNPDRLRAEYLANLLASPEYQDLVYSMVTGSTGQLELNKTNLERLPILYPPLDVQLRLCQLWEPLYQSITLCDTMRQQCESAIRLLLDRDVLNIWKEARWEEEAGAAGHD